MRFCPQQNICHQILVVPGSDLCKQENKPAKPIIRFQGSWEPLFPAQSLGPWGHRGPPCSPGAAVSAEAAGQFPSFLFPFSFIGPCGHQVRTAPPARSHACDDGTQRATGRVSTGKPPSPAGWGPEPPGTRWRSRAAPVPSGCWWESPMVRPCGSGPNAAFLRRRGQETLCQKLDRSPGPRAQGLLCHRRSLSVLLLGLKQQMSILRSSGARRVGSRQNRCLLRTCSWFMDAPSHCVLTWRRGGSLLQGH